jgi:large subunit ribosomal protein L35
VPKNKTHSGAKKRFKVTGSGKLRREQGGKRHNFERKPSSLTRRLAADADVAPADARSVKRMLGR